ncbi:MAG: MBL fold metallo-hydrolase [Candidatus Hatepunaea meridiana]|nr:MBL fold metallo-hydrolase [Candidatus Hatepunaea meridiana]
MDDKVRAVLDRIRWLGHASFKLTGFKTIYIDPWKLPEGVGGDGDLVLVTHDHYDHCSPADIKKALGSGGSVLMAECCRNKYSKADKYTLPWIKHEIAGIKVYATAAYNINKQFHPKELGHVGYVIELDGVKVYHSGDCDAFPHMRDITCDIALLPVSGTYVMDPLEAVDACDMLKPQVAIPMHWGDPEVVGTKADAERFAKLASCEVVILDRK